MDVVYVKKNAAVHWEGRVRRVRRGDAWSATDPLVVAKPWLFDHDPEVHGSEPPVERATRAPGERRAAVKRTPKADSSG
jgi:hypothetical protein